LQNDRVNIERIRERLQDGFRPFAVVTSSGDKYPVPHPEFIMLAANRAVVITNRHGRIDILDPLHISGLAELSTRPKGRRSRRR
jgi:hypothetical protein